MLQALTLLGHVQPLFTPSIHKVGCRNSV